MIIGAICARGGSKGILRKNIKPLAGKPLIAYTIECAKACPLLDKIIVSTDDLEIAAIAKKYGAEVPFMRPSHLAQDNSAKWAVFQHIVSTFENLTGSSIDILVDLDIAVPLRLPSDITDCLNKLLEGHAEVVVTAYEAERNPYFNMVELNNHGLAKIVKPLKKPVVCRQEAPLVYSLSPAVYAIYRDTLWKYEHWSEAKLQILVIPRERAIDIDNELDFRMVDCLINRSRGEDQ